MDYPKSVPSVGLVGGKFVDEDPLAGTPGSLIPAQWGNGVTEEILHVIEGGGLVPDEFSNTQLLAAIKAVAVSNGVTPGRLLNIIGFGLAGGAGTTVYNPTPGTRFVYVEVVGGGGGGGGCAATAAGQIAAAGGGGAGGRSASRITAGFAGVSVTVGIGGAGGAAGANTGGSGGFSSFGAFITATGGAGGVGGAASVPPGAVAGGVAGSGSGGTLGNFSGEFGGNSQILSTANAVSGKGGSSFYGGGAAPRGSASPGVGVPGVSSGSGGGGALTLVSSAAQAGGAGAVGAVIVWEYA